MRITLSNITTMFSQSQSFLTFHSFNLFREASYMLNSEYSLAPPKVYELEITSHCAGQCITCPKTYTFTRQANHMPLDLFKDIVSQLFLPAHINSPGTPPAFFLFHYGDLCLYPHIYETVTFARQKGLYCVSSSMASLLTREKASEVIEAGLDQIWLMLDGMDDQTCKKIRGNAASFQKSLDNIQQLLLLKKTKGITHPEIFIFMIRQPGNAHQWKMFEEYFTQFSSELHFQLAYYSRFGGNVPEINRMHKELQKMYGQPEEDERIQQLNQYRCYYPWHSVCVLSDGRVVPCCRDMNGEYVLGDLTQKTLKEIWNDAPLRALRREWVNGKIQNSLCLPCSEANNEISLPNKSFPFFSTIDQLFPERFRNIRKGKSSTGLFCQESPKGV